MFQSTSQHISSHIIINGGKNKSFTTHLGMETIPPISGDLGDGTWQCFTHTGGNFISLYINQSYHGLHHTIINMPLMIPQYHYHPITNHYIMDDIPITKVQLASMTIILPWLPLVILHITTININRNHDLLWSNHDLPSFTSIKPVTSTNTAKSYLPNENPMKD